MLPTVYFSDLQKHEPLSRREEEKLTARLKERPSAADRDRLITSNLRYVVAMAMRYRNCGIPLEDLINEGNIGLIEAVSRYDPRRGTRFLTYATWWIRKSMLGALARQTLVRIPPYRQKQIRRARKEEESLAMRLEASEGEPRAHDASAGLDRAVQELDALLGTTPKEISLEEMSPQEGDRPFDDLVASRDQVDPEARMIKEQENTTVRAAMARLSGLERSVIEGRFGMGEKASRTLRQIGGELGISRENVRQIEIRSKAKIRRDVLKRSRAAKKGMTGYRVPTSSQVALSLLN